MMERNPRLRWVIIFSYKYEISYTANFNLFLLQKPSAKKAKKDGGKKDTSKKDAAKKDDSEGDKSAGEKSSEEEKKRKKPSKKETPVSFEP